MSCNTTVLHKGYPEHTEHPNSPSFKNPAVQTCEKQTLARTLCRLGKRLFRWIYSICNSIRCVNHRWRHCWPPAQVGQQTLGMVHHTVRTSKFCVDRSTKGRNSWNNYHRRSHYHDVWPSNTVRPVAIHAVLYIMYDSTACLVAHRKRHDHSRL